MKKSQEQFVIDCLRARGEVTRNEALRNYISRLGAIIYNLNREKWVIKGEYRKYSGGKDFVYTLISEPPKSNYQIMHERYRSGETKQPTLI